MYQGQVYPRTELLTMREKLLFTSLHEVYNNIINIQFANTSPHVDEEHEREAVDDKDGEVDKDTD